MNEMNEKLYNNIYDNINDETIDDINNNTKDISNQLFRREK